MNYVRSSEEAQMMTLEALIASLLIIVAVLFVVSQVPPKVQQEGGYSEVQLRHYGEDVVTMLEANPSLDGDYQNLLQYYISENKYEDLDDFLNDSLPDNVGYTVALVSGDVSENLFSKGDPIGELIVVSEIVASKNVSIGGIPGAVAGIRKVTKIFPAGSLIIPMDDISDTDGTAQKNILPGMGLVYEITNGTYSNGTPIPVWEILQDPRGESSPVMCFNTQINTSTNLLDPSMNNNYRFYGGGPYIIDESDLTSEIRQQIIDASKNGTVSEVDDVTLHQILNDFTSYFTVELISAPKIAAYPPNSPNSSEGYMSELDNTIGKYYLHSGIPYTIINDSMILNGDLADIDIITIPHANLAPMPDNVAEKLIDWVSNGGVIHAECLSIQTLEDKVEIVDTDPSHSWYGFIGVENGVSYKNFSDETGLYYDPGRSMIFVGNDTIGYDNSSVYGDYADPGSVFNVLCQSGDKNGRLPGSPDAYVPSLKFIQHPNGSINYQKINPDFTILAGAGSLSDQSDTSNVDYSNFTYVSAPFDKGFVTYLAGHDVSVELDETTRTHHKERLMFHTLFYPGFRKIYDYGVAELQITMWYK